MREKRGLFGLIITNVLIMITAIVVFAAPYIVRADDTVVKRPVQSGWYELYEDDKVLTIKLDDNTAGYNWFYGASNDALYKLYKDDIENDPVNIQIESTNEEWIVSFKAREGVTGDSVLKFMRQKGMNKPVETKKLRVHITDDSRIVVLGEES